jgi:hypothetical protein
VCVIVVSGESLCLCACARASVGAGVGIISGWVHAGFMYDSVSLSACLCVCNKCIMCVCKRI